jgi:hypothetical protein
MWIKRLTLFFCFMLSGILLDAYWTWHSYRFAAECSESGNTEPASFFLFTIISAIPAITSITFGRSPIYIVICLGAWLFFILSSFLVIENQFAIEKQIGLNCYRDIGSGQVVSFMFTAIFSIVIIAVTLAFGAAALARHLQSNKIKS